MAGQQRKGGLGRGLAALIPSGPESGPQIGNAAADAIFGPRGDGPRTTPPRPGSRTPRPLGESGVDAGSDAGTESSRGSSTSRTEDSVGVSRETVSRETPELVDGGAVYREIPPSSIEPNPKQPRSVFDEEALAELAHSVKEFGLLQPVVVREMPDGRYQLIMGERRWRASQRAELEAIPAIVRQTEDQDLLRDALLENIHRVQLNPLEEAAAYQQLLEEFDVTQSELANRIGRSRPAITNSIRLLALPTAVQRRVAAGVLSAGHARALLGLTSGSADQDKLAARIVAEGLSVRATEELVTLANRDGTEMAQSSEKSGSSVRKNNPETDAMAQKLSDALETSVTISMGRRKGRITIDIGDAEDLRRVVGLLGEALG